MTNNGLEQLIYGRPTKDSRPTEEFYTLAMSQGLDTESATRFREVIPIEPLPYPDAEQSQAVAIVEYSDDMFLLARAHNQNGDLDHPIYQYVVLPDDVVYAMGGDIRLLIDLVDLPLPVYNAPNTLVDGLKLPAPATWTMDKRTGQLSRVLERWFKGDFESFVGLLGAVLDDRQLIIQNFSPVMQDRVQLVQGLMMLLPSAIRPCLTFATHMTVIEDTAPRLVFSESTPADTNRWIVDWSTYESPEPSWLANLFTNHLLELWDGDMLDFVKATKLMDLSTRRTNSNHSFQETLTALVERNQLDQQVQAGKELDAQALTDALAGDVSPQGKLRGQYLELLLNHALNERNEEAGTLVAQEMDKDPALDTALSDIFAEALETQPDAVYVFYRNRLTDGVDSKWIPRLKNAAHASLAVAIEEGDNDTLVSWLRLISREPSNYGLGDVLHEGIRATLPRARQDGLLGVDLIRIAAKHDADGLSLLLADEALMNQLPEPTRSAFQQADSESLEELAEDSPELFLIALHESLQTTQADSITPTIVKALWERVDSEQAANLPESYQPISLIRTLTSDASTNLSDTGLETLLTLMLQDEADNLVLESAPYLHQQDRLFPALNTAIQHAGQEIEQVLAFLNHLVDDAAISVAEIIAVSIDLLVSWDWHESTLPLIEQVGRQLQQHREIDVLPVVLWKLLEVGAETENEQLARTATQRLQQVTGSVAVEGQVVENLLRLHKQVAWSPVVQEAYLGWWRGYVKVQSLGQLQRIDRELDGKRPLEIERQILQTAVAFRKIMGNRSLAEFANAISLVHQLLEDFTSALDPTGKSPIAIDHLTLSDELADYRDELSPDERFILAKNLRELAQLIPIMSDKRTKPSLIRSDDVLDRQIISGAQNPQGAVDMFKWLSGYWDKPQAEDESE